MSFIIRFRLVLSGGYAESIRKLQPDYSYYFYDYYFDAVHGDHQCSSYYHFIIYKSIYCL